MDDIPPFLSVSPPPITPSKDDNGDYLEFLRSRTNERDYKRGFLPPIESDGINVKFVFDPGSGTFNPECEMKTDAELPESEYNVEAYFVPDSKTETSDIKTCDPSVDVKTCEKFNKNAFDSECHMKADLDDFDLEYTMKAGVNTAVYARSESDVNEISTSNGRDFDNESITINGENENQILDCEDRDAKGNNNLHFAVSDPYFEKRPAAEEIDLNISDSSEDEFGDFNFVPCSLVQDSNLEENVTVEGMAEAAVKSAIDANEITPVEMDDDNFGDFESIDFAVPGSNEIIASKYAQHCENKSGVDWNEIFRVPLEDMEDIETNINSIEGKLNTSSVWCKMKDVDQCPAMSYCWSFSSSIKILLSALAVDTNNGALGNPRWDSEMPRFAANLGFMPLVPQKTTLSTAKSADKEKELPAQVKKENTRVQFDWTEGGTSQLVNYDLLHLDFATLDTNYYERRRTKEEKARSPDCSSLHSTGRRGSGEIRANEEVTRLLNKIPDLTVMDRDYIVFP